MNTLSVSMTDAGTSEKSCNSTEKPAGGTHRNHIAKAFNMEEGLFGSVKEEACSRLVFLRTDLDDFDALIVGKTFPILRAIVSKISPVFKKRSVETSKKARTGQLTSRIRRLRL